MSDADLPVMPGSDIATAWDFIESVIGQREPLLLADLNSGASDADLDAAQQAIGVTFPEDFRQFYRRHDGQVGQTISLGLFFGMQFMTLAQVVESWHFWRDLLASDPGTYGKPGDSASVPAGAIDTRYIHGGWVPFATDLCGNHLGLDFAPGEAGTIGQVITFGRDVRKKFVLGSSFEEFILWIQPKFWLGHSVFVEPPELPPGTRCFTLGQPAAVDAIGLIHFLDRG
jgi:internalin A